MPVKRSLKLDVSSQENSPKSWRTSGHFVASYSPTTGTCQISPYSSPKSRNGQEFGNGPSNVREYKVPARLFISYLTLEQMDLDQTHTFPRRGQPRAEDKDDILTLLYKIDSSIEKVTETWKSLKHLQALLGRPELESLLGVSSASLDLRGQVKRTRELMMKVRKQEQLKKKTLKHFSRDLKPRPVLWVDTDGMSHYHHMILVISTAMNSSNPLLTEALGRNAFSMNTKFDICLVIFKGSEEMFVNQSA